MTFFAVGVAVNILNFMTADTLLGGVLVLFVDVARRAGGFLVPSPEFEIGFVVVECGFFPAGGGMTILAFFALLAFVNIVFFVAADAAGGRISVFFVFFVTLVAFCLDVAAFQPEVSLVVIEGQRVEQDNVVLSALVFSMAMLAVEAAVCGQATVIAGFVADVIENVFVFVAFHAQTTLSRL